MKERKEESKKGLENLERAKGEEKNSEKPLSWWGNQLGQKAIFRGLKGNTVDGPWKAGQKKKKRKEKKTVHVVHGKDWHTPARVMCLLLQMGASCWKVGVGAQNQGGNSCWFQKDNWKG